MIKWHRQKETIKVLRKKKKILIVEMRCWVQKPCASPSSTFSSISSSFPTTLVKGSQSRQSASTFLDFSIFSLGKSTIYVLSSHSRPQLLYLNDIQYPLSKLNSVFYRWIIIYPILKLYCFTIYLNNYLVESFAIIKNNYCHQSKKKESEEP